MRPDPVPDRSARRLTPVTAAWAYGRVNFTFTVSRLLTIVPLASPGANSQSRTASMADCVKRPAGCTTRASATRPASVIVASTTTTPFRSLTTAMGGYTGRTALIRTGATALVVTV